MLLTQEPFIEFGAVEGRAATSPRQPPPTVVVALNDGPQFQHLAQRQSQRCRRDGQVLAALVLHAQFDAEPDLAQRHQLLTECARRLCSRVRATDGVARWQECHFGVMLPKCDSANAQVVLARLLRFCSGNYRLGDQLLSLHLQGQLISLPP